MGPDNLKCNFTIQKTKGLFNGWNNKRKYKNRVRSRGN